MANLLREKTTQPDNVRSLLRGLYSSEANLIPDYEKGTLTVQLHHQANRSLDEAIHRLCNELNATETQFPRTNLRMIFKLGSNQNP
jgi:transposase-like protein